MGGGSGGGAMGGGTGGGATGGGATTGGGTGGGATGGGTGGGGATGGGGITPTPFPRVVMGREPLPIPANESTDVEVDSTGRFHVMSNVQGDPDGGLFYSVREVDGGWWSERVVTSQGFQSVGAGVKIELDSAQQPHIAFTWADLPGNGLRTRLFYGTRDDAGWRTEEIEDAGYQVSIFFGFELANDVPHLGYRVRNALGPDGGLINHARWGSRSGGTWTLETIDTFDESMAATAVTVTADGVPHVFFRQLDAGSQVIRHAARTAPGTWAREDIAQNGVVRAWATHVGNDLHLIVAGGIYRRINGAWSLAGQAANNAPVILALPNGEVWDFSALGSGNSRELLTGRYVNGQYELSPDAGLNGILYQGWDFDPTNGSFVGSLNTGAGIELVRLP